MAFRYPFGHRSAWPDDAGLPFCIRRPAALMGFNTSFAGLIPQPGGHAMLALHGASSASTPLCTVTSTFLPVRAHVPFVPLRPPRLIFVGVTDRLLELTRSAKSDRPGMRWRRLLGFDSRLRSVAPAHVWPERRSCLGLCLLQGCRARSCASAGLDPATDHQPPERRADNSFAAGRFLSAHGLARRSFPSRFAP